MKNILLFILGSLFIIGCNNKLKRTYDPNNFESDLSELRQDGQASDDDLRLLAKYVLITRIEGINIDGKTYQEIIDQMKEVQESTLKSAGNTANQENRKERIDRAMAVKLVSKELIKSAKHDSIEYTFTFSNTSHREVRKLQGMYSLRDFMDREIKKIDIVLNEPVPGMGTITRKFIFNFNPLRNDDIKINSTSLEHLHLVWNPDHVIYTDGTFLN